MAEPTLDLLLNRLIEHDVEFVIIGGFAAAIHGSAMVTEDLDICCPFTTENLLRIQEALRDVHPVHRMTPDKKPLNLTPPNCRLLKNLYLSTDIGQLDCLSRITGVGDYDQAKRESILIELEKGACRVLGLDALIRAKEAMRSRKDLLTAMELKAIRERSADGR